MESVKMIKKKEDTNKQLEIDTLRQPKTYVLLLYNIYG